MSSDGDEYLEREEEKGERGGQSNEIMTPELKRKRGPEEDHEVKRRKEFDSWKDLEDLMRARTPRGNRRRSERGEPSHHFIEIWEEVWDDDLKRAHRRNFYRK